MRKHDSLREMLEYSLSVVVNYWLLVIVVDRNLGSTRVLYRRHTIDITGAQSEGGVDD